MSEDKRHQIFVSSTAQDLRSERQKIWETLVSLNLIVSGMEAFPATNEAQFEFIKKQITLSDYYVLILAGRYGSLTDEGISFTEKEFDFAQELKIPTYVFPIRDLSSVAIGKTDQDQDKHKKLEAFRTKAMKNRLCSHWDTSDELALAVLKAILNAIKDNPRPGWQRGTETDTTQLLTELRQLRIENDELKSAAQAKMLGVSNNSIEQELRKAYSFSYYLKSDSAKYDSLQLSLKSILSEMSIFEPPHFELFEECLRGAICSRTGIKFDDVQVERAETDRVILLLVKVGVLAIQKTSIGLSIREGDYWIAAHSEAKLNR